MSKFQKSRQSFSGFVPNEINFVRVVVDTANGKVVPLVATGKHGRQLADLQCIEIDLEHVRECCNLLLKNHNLNSNEDVDARATKRSLLDSAVIRYRRCFGQGVRRKLLHREVLALEGVDVGLHHYFLAKADKHVAHSVNRLEVPIPAVIPGTGNNPTDGHVVVSFDFGDEVSDRLFAFGQLVESILQKIVEPQKSELETLFEIEVGALTHEEVAKLKPMSVPANLTTSGLLKPR